MPALAVMLNDRRWTTSTEPVNIASRIQGLAVSHAIFASKPVVDYSQSSALLQNAIAPRPQLRRSDAIAGECHNKSPDVWKLAR